MSHFTVLVPATDESDLERKLIPYYEYGCSVEFDRKVKPYLVFEDVESEYREKYETEKVDRVQMEDGEIVTPWDDRFKVGGSIGWGSNSHRVPGNLKRIEVPVKELYKTFELFIEDYAGYRLDPEIKKYGSYRNPNAKWDWYSVGGRWTGLLHLKPGKQGENGRPGLMTEANTDSKRCDVALAGDVDWFAVEEKYINNRLNEYHDRQNFINAASDLKDIPDSIYQKAIDLFVGDKSPRGDQARSIFKTLERCLQWEYAEYLAKKEDPKTYWFDDWEEIERFLMTEEEFSATITSVAQTYAFIDLEGNWNQRGQMGWFGCSDESKGTQDYDSAWWEFVKSIPSDQYVFIVDCHI